MQARETSVVPTLVKVKVEYSNSLTAVSIVKEKLAWMTANGTAVSYDLHVISGCDVPTCKGSQVRSAVANPLERFKKQFNPRKSLE